MPAEDIILQKKIRETPVQTAISNSIILHEIAFRTNLLIRVVHGVINGIVWQSQGGFPYS